ncbi:hypothetical protein, conserved [Leishmania tarentolae]|uniref:Uncharacterized protein n=1 Tax=Leishmania tarentolae TaxID=5689 RepID=A0A640KHZ8_LEITA|nr:hypothetical protein, conserved [Leishmania tarentolae]
MRAYVGEGEGGCVQPTCVCVSPRPCRFSILSPPPPLSLSLCLPTHRHTRTTLRSCSLPFIVSLLPSYCMFSVGGFGSVASSGAPHPSGARGRGGGVLGSPSNAGYHTAGGPALVNAVGNSSGSAGILYDCFTSQPGSYSPFGGGNEAVPPPVLGGAVSVQVGDNSSNSAGYHGNTNVSGSQHSVLPMSRTALPLSTTPTFGAAAPAATTVPLPVSLAATPLSAVPVFASPMLASVPLQPTMSTSSSGSILSGSGSSAQIFSNVSFTDPRGGQGRSGGNSKESGAKVGAGNHSPLPERHFSHQRSQESLPQLGSTSIFAPTVAPTVRFSDLSSAGASSTARNSNNNMSGTSGSVLATAIPVLPTAAAQSTQSASDAKGLIPGSAFETLGPAGKGGNAVGVPPPLSPTSSVLGASVSMTNTSAAPLSSSVETPPFSKPRSMSAAVKGSVFTSSATASAAGPPVLASVAVPPSAFSGSVFSKTSGAAVTAPSSAIPPAASPPPAAAKTAAIGMNRSGSVFSELNSSFGAPPLTTATPILPVFGTGLPVTPGPTPSSTSLGQQAAPRGGSNVPASFHASPCAPSPLSAGAVSKPAGTASAFGSVASGLGPGIGGSSVFTAAAAAATPAPGPVSSFGTSSTSGQVQPAAPPKPSGSRAVGGGGDATVGRRRGRSEPRREAAEGDGGGSSNPARPHLSGLAVSASPSAQGSRFEIPAPRHGQHRLAPSRLHTQKPPTALSKLDKLPIPPLPDNEKKLCIAARLCKSFLMQLASAAALGGHSGGAVSSSREEDVAKTLEHAFFGVVGIEGVHGDFSNTAGEMLALWNGQVRPMISGRSNRSAGDSGSSFPGEMWIALFLLGTYLNTILSTLQSSKSGRYAATSSATASVTDLAAYKAGLRAHPTEALTDACHYANELSELLQTLFQRGGEADAPPYSIIPVVLRRVRSVFDEANARGVATVQSNLNTVTSKLFAVLNRRVKTSAVQPLGAPGEAPRWLLTYDSKEKESLLHSFAYLIMEMIAADAPMNDDVELFISAFHESFPSALAERCMLYYRCACALLRQPLRVSLVEEAAELLAKATVVYPPNAPLANRRVLLVKLLAAELALGRLPPDDDWLALDVPQLIDVVNALKTSRLDLLDTALSMHGSFFVEIGVHNVLCLTRQRLALLMVVKFYLTHGCESRLQVSEMVRYHRLPYSAADAGVVWLLPLLVEKHINGVLDHDYLILSAKAPFDAYQRETLASAAAAA